LHAAGRSESWIAENIDAIMADATPGVVQKGGSAVLPVGVIAGALTILLTSESAIAADTTNSPSIIQAQLQGMITRIANSPCKCKNSILSDLISTVASSVHPEQVYAGQSHPIWSYSLGLLGYFAFAHDEWKTEYLPDWSVVAKATANAALALERCEHCQN
jgi:hypothetical protein